MIFKTNKILFFFFFIFSTSVQAQVPLLDSSGKPCAELVEIFAFFDPGLAVNPTLERLNAYGQKQFIRPAGKERQSPETATHYEKMLAPLSAEQKKSLLMNFDRLGFVGPKYPDSPQGKVVVIMGSLLDNMRWRLHFLNQLVKEGRLEVTPKTEIVFLAGDRPLFPAETKQAFLGSKGYPIQHGWKAPVQLPLNEKGIPAFIWDQMALSSELRKAKVKFVRAPMKKGDTRARTEDTIVAWIKDYGAKPGEYLILSSNPYIPYQVLATQRVFLGEGFKGYQFEGIGPQNQSDQTDSPLQIGLLLDVLTRALYQEVQMKENRG